MWNHYEPTYQPKLNSFKKWTWESRCPKLQCHQEGSRDHDASWGCESCEKVRGAKGRRSFPRRRPGEMIKPYHGYQVTIHAVLQSTSSNPHDVEKKYRLWLSTRPHWGNLNSKILGGKTECLDTHVVPSPKTPRWSLQMPLLWTLGMLLLDILETGTGPQGSAMEVSFPFGLKMPLSFPKDRAPQGLLLPQQEKGQRLTSGEV